VPLLVAALHAHVLYAGVDLICDALGQITDKHPLASAQAGAAGAVAAVVAAMRAHPASTMLQASGCYAICSLAFADEMQTAAIHAGAIEAILQALRAHAADAHVQTYGCRALSNIATDGTAAIDARSSSLVLEATKAAVAALHAHRANAGLMRDACAALQRLAVTDALRTEAGKIGAVTAVVAALRSHPADASLQQAACDATSNLCFPNSANAVQACGAGALQALVAALRAHAANVAVQIAACEMLSCLVKAHPRLQAAAGAAGAVEAVINAMRTPVADAPLQRASCGALLTVVLGHRGNSTRACASGIMDALAVITSTSYAHQATATEYCVYDCAVRLLDALLQCDDDAAQRAVHAGVLDILAREGTRRSHQTVRSVHASVVQMLQAAALRHDSTICTHDGCKRCAAARDAGRMCALPGCCARRRDGDGCKKLLRCGSCRAACYCAPAHQRADWGRHKEECATLRAANEEAE
jgi:hypothetical protein